MQGPRVVRFATAAAAVAAALLFALLPRPVEGAAAGRGGAASGAAGGAAAPMAVEIRVVQIGASGSGGPQSIPRELDELKGALKRFGYQTYTVQDDSTHMGGATVVLENKDVLTVKVRLVQGDQIHLRVILERNLKSIMDTNVTLRSGKWTMIGGDMGSSGKGLFVALSAK